MAHAYQSLHSFRESGNQSMKTTNQFFVNCNCLSLDAFLKKTVFFSLKLIYGGGDGGFLKYMSVIPLN